SGFLQDRADAGDRLLDEPRRAGDGRLWPGDAADAKARQCERFREAGHDQGAIAHAGKARDADVLVLAIDEIVEALIRDDPEIVAAGDLRDRAELFVRKDTARRIVRRVDDDAADLAPWHLRQVVRTNPEFGTAKPQG